MNVPVTLSSSFQGVPSETTPSPCLSLLVAQICDSLSVKICPAPITDNWFFLSIVSTQNQILHLQQHWIFASPLLDASCCNRRLIESIHEVDCLGWNWIRSGVWEVVGSWLGMSAFASSFSGLYLMVCSYTLPTIALNVEAVVRVALISLQMCCNSGLWSDETNWNILFNWPLPVRILIRFWDGCNSYQILGCPCSEYCNWRNSVYSIVIVFIVHFKTVQFCGPMLLVLLLTGLMSW